MHHHKSNTNRSLFPQREALPSDSESETQLDHIPFAGEISGTSKLQFPSNRIGMGERMIPVFPSEASSRAAAMEICASDQNFSVDGVEYVTRPEPSRLDANWSSQNSAPGTQSGGVATSSSRGLAAANNTSAPPQIPVE